MTSSLSSTDFAALSPLLIIFIGALMILLLETLNDNLSKRFSSAFTKLVLLTAFLSVIIAPISKNDLLTPWLSFNPFLKLFNLLFIFIGFGTTILSSPFFQRFNVSRGEFFFLLLSSVFGLMLIGSSADFLTLFIGLETLSISLYVLCCYMKSWERSSESSIKYFLIGSLATALLLYGIALIYGAIGSTSFDTLQNGYHEMSNSQSGALFLTGIALVTIGLCFKAAIVPFQFWAPDVYEGASNPITAFMAIGTKAGAFAAFIQVFLIALPNFDVRWSKAMGVLIVSTLIYANFVAIRQTQLRRFFAYSGISHAGFLLIPVIAGTPQALQSMIYYLIVYVIATFGAFGVLAFLDQRPQGVVLRDLYGLFKRSPLLAFILAICLMTLGGIPPTAGFFAKFFIFKVAFQAGYYSVVVIGLLTTILSAYYYLRIVTVMLTEDPAEKEIPNQSNQAALLGIFAMIAILFLSIYPGEFLQT